MKKERNDNVFIIKAHDIFAKELKNIRELVRKIEKVKALKKEIQTLEHKEKEIQIDIKKQDKVLTELIKILVKERDLTKELFNID